MTEKSDIICQYENEEYCVSMWNGVILEDINIGVFNKLRKTNEFSQDMSRTHWGYFTHFVSSIESMEEASDLFRLYIEDVERKNYWWENGPNSGHIS